MGTRPAAVFHPTTAYLGDEEGEWVKTCHPKLCKCKTNPFAAAQHGGKASGDGLRLEIPVNSTLRSARVRGTSVLELADRC
jgi:hypothetical protein